jgi:hypothetical protein
MARPVVGTQFGRICALGLPLGTAAWLGCVDTSGSRTDFMAQSSSATGGDDGGAAAGSSSGSGSTGSSGGGPSEAGAVAMPAAPDLCGFPPSMAMNPILYSGAPAGGGGGNCPGTLPPPRNGSWFSYHDATGDGGVSLSATPALGGCGGISLCAFHIDGPIPADAGGFSIYGAGCGFDLNDNASGTATNYDLTPYTGIQYWAKGTINGTRGPGFAASPQTIHLKIVTATNRDGDDYGAYCQMIDPTIWTLCSVAFSALTRDGFSTTPDPATDTFDANQAQKVQFEFSLATGGAVSFDAWIDEVSFY